MNVISSQTIYPVFSWETLLLVALVVFVGVVLFAMELFILPGFGVAGILGLAGMVGGSVIAWIYLGPAWGALVVVLAIVLAILLVVVALRTQLAKRLFVLDTQLEHGGGTEASDLSAFEGKLGIAKTALRPAGIATVENTRIDVVSEGGFIDSGEQIRVVSIDGPRIIVARIE